MDICSKCRRFEFAECGLSVKLLPVERLAKASRERMASAPSIAPANRLAVKIAATQSRVIAKASRAIIEDAEPDVRPVYAWTMGCCMFESKGRKQ